MHTPLNLYTKGRRSVHFVSKQVFTFMSNIAINTIVSVAHCITGTITIAMRNAVHHDRSYSYIHNKLPSAARMVVGVLFAVANL